MVEAARKGGAPQATIARIGVAVALLVAFVVIETAPAHPLMPFSIFRLRTLRGANIAGLLTGMSLFSMFLFISLYLQNVLTTARSRPESRTCHSRSRIIVAAGAASQLVTRIGFKPTLIGGMLVIVAVGLSWFSRVPAPGRLLCL